MNTKEYLGDSVYAEFDGYYIWLTTENGRADDPSNKIALEPFVMDALLSYVNRARNTVVQDLPENKPS